MLSFRSTHEWNLNFNIIFFSSAKMSVVCGQTLKFELKSECPRPAMASAGAPAAPARPISPAKTRPKTAPLKKPVFEEAVKIPQRPLEEVSQRLLNPKRVSAASTLGEDSGVIVGASATKRGLEQDVGFASGDKENYAPDLLALFSPEADAAFARECGGDHRARPPVVPKFAPVVRRAAEAPLRHPEPPTAERTVPSFKPRQRPPTSVQPCSSMPPPPAPLPPAPKLTITGAGPPQIEVKPRQGSFLDRALSPAPVAAPMGAEVLNKPVTAKISARESDRVCAVFSHLNA